ncbi:uroporphyrin-3 C-methyltransferase [Franzmannia pantelleriensis]|uniref:Uroporphyrin-3 C-methyltransferase n=1 Tax=Franzmannia pantelleriensis TaxID=48727 RepID=A0A1G9TAT6_9GAMM|nr:uroporphyrinogen-III C-methyltransferase [Halomonas pantelleriensis]SDM44766.1 uroporphyrin-3 C-methyltransferase [Halomonas pantelleriensis]
MSKQPHDQDDNQTPSGDTPPGTSSRGTDSASATSSDTASSAKGGGRSRSRRRGTKAPAERAAAAASSETGAAKSGDTKGSDSADAKAADVPSAAASDESGGDSKADKSSRATPKAGGGAPAKSSEPKAAAESASKPTDGKGEAGADKQPPPPRTTTPPPEDGGGSKTGLIALVLAVLLGLALLLAAWQGWERLEAQQQRIADLEARSGDAASRDELAALESRLDEGESERDAALDDALASLRGEFDDYRSEVDETLDRVLDELSSEQDADEREWLHAEAAYLLRLANQRLQLERDADGAAALLRTADGRLRDADNPALTPVRRAISSELAALDAVPRVDRTGLYLALDAQQEQLAGLPLDQDIEQIAAESGIEQPPSGNWQQQLSRFGAELRDLVTVRRHDEALEALIAPEQEAYLRQNVRLLIEQAQLALLKEEEALFEASLDKAITLVEAYYDADSEGVQRVLERLGELREAAIRPELPDISGSQQALAEFIERRFNGGADNGDDEGDEA